MTASSSGFGIRTSLKITLPASFDPEDAASVSSMSCNMIRVLRARGATVYPVPSEPWFLRLSRHILGARRRKIVRTLFCRMGLQSSQGESCKDPTAERARVLQAAQRVSESVAKRAERRNPDLIYSCCISTVLFALHTKIPIVYFSDATPDIINSTYPLYRRRSAAYKNACDEVERSSLQRCEFAVFASQITLRSAIDKYGLKPERGSVIPMGANIGRSDLGRPVFQADLPSRDRLLLCVVASDPERKRVDLAVEATEGLARRGWNVRLTYVGPYHARAKLSPVVRWVGQVTLRRSRARRQLARLISEAHFMLLPSIGEAYGIAPCEAAQFGRPSIVSDAGGLPEVVRDGETGVVLPLAAGPAEYTDAVERIASSPGLYRAMSAACRERGEREQTWDSWADRMIPIMEKAAAIRAKRPRA